MSDTQEANQRTDAELRNLAFVVEAKQNAVALLKNHPATDAKVCQALGNIFQVLESEIQAHQQYGQQLTEELKRRSQDGQERPLKVASRKKRARVKKLREVESIPDNERPE